MSEHNRQPEGKKYIQIDGSGPVDSLDALNLDAGAPGTPNPLSVAGETRGRTEKVTVDPLAKGILERANSPHLDSPLATKQAVEFAKSPNKLRYLEEILSDLKDMWNDKNHPYYNDVYQEWNRLDVSDYYYILSGLRLT